MRRSVWAFSAGVVTWIVVVSVLNLLMRLEMSGYAVAEPAMAFSLAMKWGRLTLAIIASLVTGLVVASLAPANKRLPLILGTALLGVFIPVHYGLWDKFPLWYHLVFLSSLIPAVLAGARVRERVESRRMSAQSTVTGH